jgi:hypothetical protein
MLRGLPRLLSLQGAVSSIIILAYCAPTTAGNIILRVDSESATLRVAGGRPWSWPGRLPSAKHVSLSHVDRLESGLFNTIE